LYLHRSEYSNLALKALCSTILIPGLAPPMSPEMAGVTAALAAKEQAVMEPLFVPDDKRGKQGWQRLARLLLLHQSLALIFLPIHPLIFPQPPRCEVRLSL